MLKFSIPGLGASIFSSLRWRALLAAAYRSYKFMLLFEFRFLGSGFVFCLRDVDLAISGKIWHWLRSGNS